MPPKGWSKGYCLNGHIDPPRNSAQACIQCHNERFDNAYRRKIGRKLYATKMSQAIEKLGGKCVDCGYEDSRALEFDHVPERGVKVANVAEMVGLRIFWDEVAKCDLVCANCHAIRTNIRGQRTRARID